MSSKIGYSDAVALFTSMLSDALKKTLFLESKSEITKKCNQSASAAKNLLKKMEHVFSKCGDKDDRTRLTFSIKKIQEKIELLEMGYIPELFFLVIEAMAFIGGVSQAIEHHFTQELSDYEPA
ncbi:MAG: hypothetical protein WC842_00615 [Candidatus Paceibacterota bacterium]|jgi:hypothetical protein